MNTFRLIVKICALGIFLSIISCGNKHDISTVDLEEENVLRQMTQLDGEFLQIFKQLDQSLAQSDSSGNIDCLIYKVDKDKMDTNSEHILVDLKFNGNCENFTLDKRSGSISATLKGEYLADDSQIEIKLNEYLVNDWSLFGTFIMTGFQKVKGHIFSFTIYTEEGILKNPGEQYISFEMEKKFTINQGDLTKNTDNLSIEVEGHSFGNYFKGKKFTMQSIRPLILELNCLRPNAFQIVSGIIGISIERLEGELELDFGEGSCDRLAKWTYDTWERVVWM